MTKVKEGYKESEIGVIPEEWEVDKIGNLSNVVTGKTPPTKQVELYGESFPWVTPTDINQSKDIYRTQRMLSENGYKLISAKLPANTLLITCIASIGKNAILRVEGSCNQQINAILPNEKKFSTNYLYYWISHNKTYFENFASKTAIQILNKSTFNSINVVLPPLPEQQRIAEILSTVDDHIEKLDRTIEDYQLLKKGMMQKLLTEGIGHTEFKDTEIGRIPKEWEVKRLSEIGQFRKGKGIKKNEVLSEGYRCLRYGEIYTTYDHVVTKTVSFISEETAKNSMEIKMGELVFAGSGETVEDIGKAIVYLSKDKCYVGGDTIIMDPNNSVDGLFLSYYLSTEMVAKQKRKLAQGQSIVHLYIDGVKSIKVVMPSISEQKIISQIFSSFDERIELILNEKVDFLQLKKALMEQLLTGKIRVMF